MCGIAGQISLNGILQAEAHCLVRRMCGDMAHRGPDGEGIEGFDSAVLGHRRLAIIDLSPAGRQPMCNENGTVWVVFNGEIYNHRDLRERLSAQGHIFKSRCDTEVLVHGYEEWGAVRLVEQLRGMFAFGLWDSRSNALWLARDRHGVKPLYYIAAGDRVTFCSEVRPLYRICKPTIERVKPSILDFYLNFGFSPPDEAIINGIEKLPPATLMSFTRQGPIRRTFWSLGGQTCASGDRENYSDQVKDLLEDAVQVRLESDVPMGSFLSGGIDSGIVTAIAARRKGEQLRTVTVGFENAPEDDERLLARTVAARYKTQHEELLVSGVGLGELPRLIWLAGEPFADSSLVPTSAVCQAARRSVTVALTGDGGDELFGGYSSVVAAWWGDRTRNFLGDIFSNSIAAGLRRVSNIRVVRKVSTVFDYGTSPLNVLYTERTGNFNSFWRRELYCPAWTDRLRDGNAGSIVERYLARYLHLPKAEAYMRLDLDLRLPGDYLVKVDVASNAHSLECRSPFLDQKLAELAVRIPMSQKLKGGKQKALLRKLAREYLPAEVTKARKRGFGTDVGRWLSLGGGVALRKLMPFHIIGPENPVKEKFVERLVWEHQNGIANWGNKLWCLLCLEVWWRLFIDESLSPDAKLL